ncbi:MAG: hypothetical protein QG565_1778 [Campylobacterota bacterium]|nr:hypothetical protein [Campylobacterota bacterium]
MPSGMDLTVCSNVINELQKMTGVNYQYQVTNKYGAIKSVGLSSICQNYPLYVQRYVDAGKDIEVLETFIKRVPLSQTSDFEKFRSSQSDKKAATKYYKNEIWEKGYLDPLNGDGTEVAKCFLRDCSKSEEAHVGVNSEGYQLFIKGLVTNDFDLADKMVDKSQ